MSTPVSPSVANPGVPAPSTGPAPHPRATPEARGLALHERLATGRRDGWTADQLRRTATDGHASLGFTVDDTLELHASVQTAGMTEPLWAATASDVVPPADLDPDAVAAELAAVVDEIWSRV